MEEPLTYLAHRLASDLPPSVWSTAEFDTLFEHVSRERNRQIMHDRVRAMARRQGVKPVQRIEDLQGDFWPEEQSVDEFLALVKSIRRNEQNPH